MTIHLVPDAGVIDITPDLRRSIEARIAEKRADAVRRFAVADAIQGCADEHYHAAGRLEFEAQELADKLEAMS